MAHNLADLFEHAADAYGEDRLAVVEGERRLTYSDLDAEANRWAAALAGLGVGAGDHVGVHLRNGVDCMALFLGVLKLRAVPISVNYRYVGSELRYLYDYSDTCVTVVHREFGPVVADAVRDLDSVRHTIVVEDGSSATDLPEGALVARDVLDSASPERVAVERSADDLFLVFTGGTTGQPKGVMWRQEDLWRSLGGGADYYTGEQVPDEFHQSRSGLGGEPMRYLVLLPLIHTSGLMPSFTGLFAGGTCHYLPHFRADDVLEEIESEKIQVAIVAGDAMVRPMLDRMRATGAETSSMFMVSSGAALVSPSLAGDLSELPSARAADVREEIDSEKLHVAIVAGDAMVRPMLDRMRATGAETSSMFMVSSGAALFSPSLKAELLELRPDLMIMDAFGSSESGFGGLGTVTKANVDD